MKTNQIIIFTLLISQPIIDIITSLTTTWLPISLGALLKTCIMITLWIIIFQYICKKRKQLIWIYLSSYLSIFLMLLVNWLFKEHYILFAEFNLALKTAYYVTMTFTAVVLFNQELINQALINRSIKIISMIIGLSYWLAITTGTSLQSYQYDGAGFSGWFYSANELSVTLLILFGLSLSILTKEKKVSSFLAVSLTLSMTPMIGTKTAFFGGMILLISWLFLSASVSIKQRKWKQKGIGVVFILLVSFFFLLPHTPIIANMTSQDTGTPPTSEDKSTLKEHDPLLGKNMLSSRDLYFTAIKEDFFKANGIRKAFGLGYAGDYTSEPALIEMDFFDLFFSYGFVGTLLLLIPLIYIIGGMLPIRPTISYITLLCTVGLCFGISFLAGHVLFAPAVQTYLFILFITLNQEVIPNEQLS